MKKHNGMRPQDILIILKLISQTKQENSGSEFYKSVDNQNKNIAKSLEMSEAEISESLRRSEYAGLISDRTTKQVNKRAILEFLLHGIKYVFPIHPGAIVRGIPTAHSALPISSNIVSNEMFVWEHPEGKARGQAIIPLYHTIPNVIENDEKLYELLALVDAIRTGTARINKIASEELEKRILMQW
jgi:DNA-binding Lrp family transcriptional regulator